MMYWLLGIILVLDVAIVLVLMCRADDEEDDWEGV